MVRTPTLEASAVAGEMPERSTQVRRFAKARAARLTTLLEDYAELIGDLHAAHGEARTVDVARRLGVTQATAVKGVARLKRAGLVSGRPYRGIFLTEAGEKLADRVRARHRLMLELLLAVGVPRDVAETDAEGMEHHVSEATLKAFAEFLDQRCKV